MLIIIVIVLLTILRRKKHPIIPDNVNDPQFNPYYSPDHKQVEFEEEDSKKLSASSPHTREEPIYEPLDSMLPPITADTVLKYDVPQACATSRSPNQSTDRPPLPNRERVSSHSNAYENLHSSHDAPNAASSIISMPSSPSSDKIVKTETDAKMIVEAGIESDGAEHHTYDRVQ